MLKGKITPVLCINLEDYEAKLERLNSLVQKMSSIDWTGESAIQFCKDQGIQVEDFMLPQFTSLQALFDNLNTFNYKAIEEKIAISKLQIETLKFEKFDDYNLPYKNHINNIFT